MSAAMNGRNAREHACDLLAAGEGTRMRSHAGRRCCTRRRGGARLGHVLAALAEVTLDPAGCGGWA